MVQLRVDPAYGIPAGTPPLCFDTTNGYVRAASSFATEDAANAMFIGYSWEYFPPGEDHLVWVHTCGWVEMELEDATALNVLDKYILGTHPTSGLIGEALQPAGEETPLFEVVQVCWCQNDWEKRVNCPVEAAEAADVSATTTSTDMLTQRSAIFSYCCCINADHYYVGPIQ